MSIYRIFIEVEWSCINTKHRHFGFSTNLLFQQIIKLGNQKFMFPFNIGVNLTLDLLHLTFFIKHKFCPWYLIRLSILEFSRSFIQFAFLPLSIFLGHLQLNPISLIRIRHNTLKSRVKGSKWCKLWRWCISCWFLNKGANREDKAESKVIWHFQRNHIHIIYYSWSSLKAKTLNFKFKEIITLINLKPLSNNKFQRHEKFTISLEKDIFLTTSKIEESTLSMEKKILVGYEVTSWVIIYKF